MFYTCLFFSSIFCSKGLRGLAQCPLRCFDWGTEVVAAASCMGGFLLPPVPMCNGLPMAAAAEMLCL
jgi:hypothetical protein